MDDKSNQNNTDFSKLIPASVDKIKVNSEIAHEMNIKDNIIEKTITLLSEGNTIPFIARYRKEVTEDLDEIKIRDIQKSYERKINLEQRKLDILRLINQQGKLTDQLIKQISSVTTLQEVEDIYLPFKPKLKTLGTKAKEKGLQPLADMIRKGIQKGDPLKLAAQYVNPEKEVANPDVALEGAIDIIAEDIGSEPEVRQYVRKIVETRSVMTSKVNEKKLQELTTDLKEDGEIDTESLGKKKIDPYTFQDYFDNKINIFTLKPYQILAIDRAEDAEIINISLDTPDEEMIHELKKIVLKDNQTSSTNIFQPFLEKAINAGYNRYVNRSIKREIRAKLREEAENHAIKVFATNLKHLLMTSPLKKQAVIGIDPGFRTGCKVAVIDKYGKYLDHGVIYPFPPKNKVDEANKMLLSFAQKYQAFTFSIGNGTASQETEAFITNFIKTNKNSKQPFMYSIVNEAGASVYSASDLAIEEFPKLDVTIRGAISIARRLQDPLSELIKIDPKSIGVGLYQHDVNQNQLKQELDAVIEDCVNAVGVDINTASSKLLEYVSGLNKRVAKEIVKTREEQGPFKTRKQLNDIKGLGPKSFEQAAGFLKVRDAPNPLDGTFVHPESYQLTEQLLNEAQVSLNDLIDPLKRDTIKAKLETLKPNALARKYNINADKIRYLIQQLLRPDLDPRDEIPPLLRSESLSIDNLEPGMILKGTVRNVVDFGAFVDIGVKINGLVHKSEIANTFVKDPSEFLAVGDIKDFKILSIDKARNRIQLTLKY